jgi:phosphohistidine swiveling domain-containing protein
MESPAGKERFLTLGTYSISILHYSLFYDDGRGLVFRRPVRVHRGLQCEYYMYEEDAQLLMRGLREKLKDPQFIYTFSAQHERDYEKLWSCIQRFRAHMPSSTADLGALWHEYWDLLQRSQPLGDCFLALDEAYLETTRQWVASRLAGKEVDINNAMVTLSSPWKNFETMEEQIDLYALACACRAHPLPRSVEEFRSNPTSALKIFEDHLEKWQWIPHWYDNEPFDAAFLFEQLKRMEGTDVEAKHRELRETTRTVMAAAHALLDELDCPQEMRARIAGLREFTFFRTHLDLHTSKALFYARPLYERVASHLGISLRQLKNLTPGEVQLGLEGKIAREEILRRIAERAELAVEMFDTAKQTVLAGEQAQAWVERIARNIVVEREQARAAGSALKGMGASPGIATGTARVLTSVEQVPQVQQGDVLVVPATSIDFVVAMKRSVAIVTEVGGLTSHAAVVARELGIPCVVNTKVATKRLRTGMRVRVDGAKGTVEIL